LLSEIPLEEQVTTFKRELLCCLNFIAGVSASFGQTSNGTIIGTVTKKTFLNRIQSTFLTILLLFGFLAGGTYATAQTSLGTLVGTARDKTGAVISHATISITNQATGQIRTGTTGDDGVYRFDAVPPGPYTFDFEATGFEKFKAKDVQVTPTTVTSYDVSAVVGSKQEMVSVEADQATINTENGQLAGVVGSVAMDKLPIFTLNPIELAMIVPGVEPVANGVGALENGVNIQVNGARPRSNNFLLDGQEINDVGITGQAFQPQIPDMFDSVTVITSAASAEYGRAGGGIVNTTTKSGTNTYHGSVFERYTGSGLNSIPGGDRGPTAVTGFEKARQDEHSYGFTGGGAILKNKLFVFGALELQRTYGTEQAGVNLLPDAAGYTTLQTINGTSGPQIALLDQYLSNGAYLTQDNTFPGINGPITKNVGALPGCPATGCVVSFAGFQRPNQSLNEPDTQWSYRADYRPWDRDSIFFRYLHDRTSLTPDFFNNPNALIGFDTEQGGPSELGEGGWTHIFTPALLNEFRVSEARIAFTFAPTAGTLANPLNDLPTLMFANTNGATAVGSVTFPNLGPDQNFPQGREEDLYQFQDTVTLTKGRQTMRMGADIGRLIEVDLVSQNALGLLTFENGGNATTSVGNFLINQLGASGSASKVFGPTRADSHGYRNGVFFQDDVKLNPDLTVNLGMRWDYLSNPENSLKYPGVDPNNPLAPIPTFVPIGNDWTNISPRLGFAYSPHGKFGVLGDGKTVLRGGFGVFYDSTFSNILVNSTQSAPVSASGLIQQVGVTSPGAATGNAGLISTISPAISQLSTVESEASDLENPITYQYNVGIEREMPGAITLTARYVGNQGRKLFANQQYNSPINGLRPDADRGEIILRGNYGRSNYNGLEVSATHNFRHGLLVSSNYTFSKDLSTADDIFSGVASTTSYGINLAPGFRNLEYGNSAFDHRQFFSVAYAYSLPGLQSSNAIANSALGALTRHWTISGITQLQSGGYDTLNINGVDTNNDLSATNDRPLVGNASLPLTSVGIDGTYIGGTAGTLYDLSQNNISGALSTVTAQQAHFIVQPSTTGNATTLAQTISRNSFLTPGTTTNNIALEKGFGLSYLHLERGNLVFRAEAQNVFNHNDSQTTDPNPLDAGVGFLTPSRVGSNRQLILWAKFKF
jgi:hypothetical protein